MVLEFAEEVSAMSWIAYYVEESTRQRQEEYARRFAHPRATSVPALPRRRWSLRGPVRRWVHRAAPGVHPGAARAAGGR
jgi:hypothetical protein